jgi:hypothetical protein
MDRECNWSKLDEVTASVREHLEELQLYHGHDPEWAHSVHPIPSLVCFTSLRTLEIGQDALLGSEYGTISESQDQIQQLSVAQLLPPNINKLVIWFPTTSSLAWLGELVASHSAVASLSQIIFQCSNKFKENFHSFSSALQSSPTFIKLGNVGIKVSVLSLGDRLYRYD